MQQTLFTTSQSAVETAETSTANDSRNGRNERASVRIGEAQEILRELLLADDQGELSLLGAVAEDLGRFDLELGQLAGLQRLFELWVADAP